MLREDISNRCNIFHSCPQLQKCCSCHSLLDNRKCSKSLDWLNNKISPKVVNNIISALFKCLWYRCAPIVQYPKNVFASFTNKSWWNHVSHFSTPRSKDLQIVLQFFSGSKLYGLRKNEHYFRNIHFYHVLTQDEPRTSTHRRKYVARIIFDLGLRLWARYHILQAVCHKPENIKRAISKLQRHLPRKCLWNMCHKSI